MKGLVHQYKDLKEDPLLDGEPMQLDQDWGDMAISAAAGGHACSRIQNTLGF